MAAALRPSRLNKACPDNFICLMDLYLFNEIILYDLKGTLKHGTAIHSHLPTKHMKNIILSKRAVDVL